MTSTIPTLRSPLRPLIERSLTAVSRIDRSYALGVFPTDQVRADWAHDLGVMANHDDLRHLRLELIGKDRVVLFEFRVEFADGPRVPGRAVREFAFPVIAREAVASHRLIVQRRGRAQTYQDALKLRWSDAPTLTKAQGSSFANGTGEHGQFHVGQDERHPMVITNTFWNRGYAFARDLKLQHPGVFLDVRDLPVGYRPVVGALITAVLVSTERGLQGRDIRPGHPDR